MIVIRNAPHPGIISLDLTQEFGQSVELEEIQFLNPPGSYRMLRAGKPLTDWKQGDRFPHQLKSEPSQGHQSRRGAHAFAVPDRSSTPGPGMKTDNLELELSGLDSSTYVLHLRSGTFEKAAVTEQHAAEEAA